MASTCAIYKGSRQIGTGSVSAASTAVGSFVQTDAVYTTKLGAFGRHVTVMITQAGALTGYTFNTRIVSDDGAGNLVLNDAVPFVGA